MLFNVLLYLRIALTPETKEWQYSSKGCAVFLSCDRRVKEATYLGLVRPLLEYASQAWDPCTDNLSNEIEKIQRRAARFVTSDYQNYELGSVTKLLKDLGWKSLKSRREVDRLCLLKKGLDNRRNPVPG